MRTPLCAWEKMTPLRLEASGVGLLGRFGSMGVDSNVQHLLRLGVAGRFGTVETTRTTVARWE